MKLKSITKRKAVTILIVIAVILAAAVIIRGPKHGLFGFNAMFDASTQQGRIDYLESLGWEVSAESEDEATVTLPEQFDGAVTDYAAMQSEQGFEFCSYGGCECKRYTYIVTNYPSDDSIVYAVLFVIGSTVIGGDIHSAEIGGFIHGIK